MGENLRISVLRISVVSLNSCLLCCQSISLRVDTIREGFYLVGLLYTSTYRDFTPDRSVEDICNALSVIVTTGIAVTTVVSFVRYYLPLFPDVVVGSNVVILAFLQSCFVHRLVKFIQRQPSSQQTIPFLSWETGPLLGM